MTVNRADDAAVEACKVIAKNTQDTIESVIWLNRNPFGHRLIRTTRGLKYYTTFKRLPFKTFGYQFEDKDMHGVGETINVEFLEKAIELECVAILIVYPNGHVYATNIGEWKSYENLFETVRRTKATGESTISVPIKLLRRWI